MATHPSHYLDLGFMALDGSDVAAILRDALAHGRTRASTGDYTVWEVGSGIEIWAIPGSHKESVEGFPRFLGESALVMEIEEPPAQTLRWADEALVRCRTHPPTEDDDVEVPVLVNFHNADVARLVADPPEFAEIQVTAFAEDVCCFETEEEHQEVHEAELPPPLDEAALAKMSRVERAHYGIDRMIAAPESYFAYGQSESPPTSEVGFSGRVRRAFLKTNPRTGLGFHHLVVKTFGGLVLDVVASGSAVEGSPIEGGIVEGEFCIEGRLTGHFWTAKDAPRRP